MTSWSFQTVRRMREAWKRETYVQSFSSESAVKYLHVGRRKIQISPLLGQQDQSNALPQGQQRESNPHPMPCLPPRRLYIDRCIISDPILPFQKFQSANWILHYFFYYLFRLSLKLYFLSPLEILNLFNMLLLRKTWESEMTRGSVAVLWVFCLRLEQI